MPTKENGQDLSNSCTPASLEKGAIEIAKGLWSHYTDVSGRKQPVGGDMTKVRYVNGLSESAHLLLKNIEHASRKLPGTQETRRIMRFQTQAYRIKYGTPLSITFSQMKVIAYSCFVSLVHAETIQSFKVAQPKHYSMFVVQMLPK